MSLTFYGHPFSSYTWKALIALYENETPFTYRSLEEPGAGEELAALWPFAKFPVLVDDGRTVAESSIIIEHLQLRHPGSVRLLPSDPQAALEVRFWDRFFDLYVMAPMNKPVAESLRPDGRKETAMGEAAKELDLAYAWLEGAMAERTWAAGDAFTLADCAAAPSLFYADWVRPIGEDYPAVRAYRARLLARPSVSRCVEDARPYRSYFPLGAPDRD